MINLRRGVKLVAATAIFTFSTAMTAVAGNLIKFVNATLMGLLLGWLYWRTGSIAPGVLLHAVNNSVALVTFRFMPGTHDMTLTEFFGGDTVRLSLFIVCSFCVFLPSLWQVWRCTK